jgi:7,8-dihydropterin-6-yl-methyl-4-(beta-D-ribofuranosyl)aminobenzene 5'-phosphate synthase
VGEGLVTTGEVPQTVTASPADSPLLRRGQAGLRRDDFRDDLSLVALLEGCSVVMTGCAHAGVLNILRQVEAVAPGRVPRVVLGGLHLATAPDEKVAEIATEAYVRGIRTLLPCHSTGPRAVRVLQAEFPGAVIPIRTGTRIRIDQDGSAAVAGP